MSETSKPTVAVEGTPKRRPTRREQEWEEKTLQPTLAKSPERLAEFTTISGYPIRRLYTPADLTDWDEDVAKVLAQQENVNLSEQHWEVVNFLREYYDEYQIAPAVRVLTKAIGKRFGAEKGNSQYLYDLFPYGPAKQACKIAGLPKPTGCI